MKKVFIKHNPYKIETEIEIDGNIIPCNSELNFEDRRFQEWVEQLPDLLVEECNTNEIEITFHGTLLDYEDLLQSIEESKKKGINITCNHVKANEISDKEQQIKKVFKDIQQGPFEELKQKDIVRAFENATKSEFEVNVVATMSAGKSTLINALLSKKLMPSKNESCTAVVSKIRDVDSSDFTAKVFDKNEELIDFKPELTYEIMESLNSQENVSIIDVEGNIPFVSSEDMSLVLVDTPGPNNSRDENHRETTYRMLSESSKTLVLYVLNATQLAVNDDNNLLSYVSESMKVGGKQSKDRFIFVVNKIDSFRKGEDSVEDSLKKVRKYLEDKGIKNPNIFPAAALPALDIRTYLKYGDKNDEDLEYEINYTTRKLTRDEEKHLEKYAPLTASIKEKIDYELSAAIEEGNKYHEGLIHTGIRSIEEYINMYVEKYAKTAKIKNIVDTFDKKLQTSKSFEKAKQDIALNRDKHKEVLEKINLTEEKINSKEEVEKFKEKIDNINFDKEIEKSIRNSTKAFQIKITEVQENAECKISKPAAKYAIDEYKRFAENIQAEVKIKLEDIVTNNVKSNVEALMNEYINKVQALSADLSIGDIELNPFALIQGEISVLKNEKNVTNMINKLTDVERVVVDQRWVENTNKRWFKPWTWLQESGHFEDVYEDVEYVDGKELARQFLAPISSSLVDNNRSAAQYAKEQSNEIKEYFKGQFDQIDEILSNKLDELKSFAKDKTTTEQAIQDSKEKLRWLEEIQGRVKKILEI